MKSDVTREMDLICRQIVAQPRNATDMGDGKGFLPMIPGFRTFGGDMRLRHTRQSIFVPDNFPDDVWLANKERHSPQSALVAENFDRQR